MKTQKVTSIVEKAFLEKERSSYEHLALENQSLRDEVVRLRQYLTDLERSADMDPLIPVYNRRAFIRELTKAISVLQRFDIPSSVVFFDMNDFKAVNDRFGHAIGDELLIKVGKLLQNHVRASDLVARLGGDEFGIILFKTSLEEAKSKAAELSEKITNLKIDIPHTRITVSGAFGVAPCRRGKTPEQILAEADEAMYDIKLAQRLQRAAAG